MNEREQAIKVLEDYFDLTRYAEEHEGATPNPEWDSGYQAAIAILKGATFAPEQTKEHPEGLGWV